MEIGDLVRIPQRPAFTFIIVEELDVLSKGDRLFKCQLLERQFLNREIADPPFERPLAELAPRGVILALESGLRLEPRHDLGMDPQPTTSRMIVDDKRLACPPGLSPDGVRAWEVVASFLIAHGLTRGAREPTFAAFGSNDDDSDERVLTIRLPEWNRDQTTVGVESLFVDHRVNGPLREAFRHTLHSQGFGFAMSYQDDQCIHVHRAWSNGTVEEARFRCGLEIESARPPSNPAYYRAVWPAEEAV